MSSAATSPVFDPLACSTANALWGAFTIEGLCRVGVHTFVISPGSRSTPLAFAAARHAKVEAIPVLDERSAAFFALGVARRQRRPVGLICTSGSALANYFPAVVEASESGVPLLLLTADRPPELRACGAGQTIDQSEFFGRYARSFIEVPLPEASGPAFAQLGKTLARSVRTSQGMDPGPVHLNFPFRDPMTPEVDAPAVADPSAVASHLPTAIALQSEEVPMPEEAATFASMQAHTRGLIMVGARNPAEEADVFVEAVLQISRTLAWPILADAPNALRFHPEAEGRVIGHYDALLRNRTLAKRLRPTAILQIGQLPTSKVLRQWLEGLSAKLWIHERRPRNVDPLHREATILRSALPQLAAPYGEAPNADSSSWLTDWQCAETAASATVDEVLAAKAELSEPALARFLARHCKQTVDWIFASSMPVRDAEYFWPPGASRGNCFSSRGANGIDGTLSTALGTAHRSEHPAVLVSGDLAFLHDSNGLLLAQQLTGSLTIFLINNEGGGIFEHLPIARFDPPFESFFATPQKVDFKQLVSAHGIPYSGISDQDTLIEAVKSIGRPGVRVFEFFTDRKRDRQFRAELLEAAAAAAAKALKP